MDEIIRALKAEIAEARSKAFTSGQYMPPGVYRAKERRLKDLKDESQALQTRIGELRRAEAAERDVEHRVYAERFVKVAEEILPEGLLQRIHGRLQEDEDEDEQSVTGGSR